MARAADTGSPIVSGTWPGSGTSIRTCSVLRRSAGAARAGYWLRLRGDDYHGGLFTDRDGRPSCYGHRLGRYSDRRGQRASLGEIRRRRRHELRSGHAHDPHLAAGPGNEALTQRVLAVIAELYARR